MKTVDGRVIRIKGNRREERVKRRKKIATGCLYFFLIAMIVLLCGILLKWILQPHESGNPAGTPEETVAAEETEDRLTDTEETKNTTTEINSSEGTETTLAPVAEIDPVRLAQVEGLLSEFKVTGTGEASNAAVHPEKYTLFGRWYKTQIGGVACNNTVTQGAMVFFKITGTDYFDIRFFNRTMMETPFFAYSIDDGDFQRQSVSDGHVSLPDFGEHTVCLVMDGMSEREFKWSGEVGFAFSDIECGSGTMSACLPDNKKTVLFLGDSLTEGIMTLGPESVSEYNSAVHSYSWYLAHELDANPYFSAYGSTGITQTGSFNTMSSTLDYLSETRPIDEKDYPACDLAVINTGTNDFEASDDEFYGGYCDLIKKLHNRYPDMPIICVIPLTQTHADQIREAVGQYEFAYIIETADWEVTYSDEARIHPDAAGSQYIAGKILEFINQNHIF